MKAITVWQPWAGALTAGIKKNETRSWAVKYRGPIAIHAAMREVFDGLALIPVPIAIKTKEALRCEWADMPRGAIIATGELVDCIKITPEFVATLSPDELALGDYTLGRYAWKLANVKRLPEPIPAKGKQGLWSWEALLLRHKGRDSWDRPVYEDETGKLWKDVEPNADRGRERGRAVLRHGNGARLRGRNRAPVHQDHRKNDRDPAIQERQGAGP